MHMRALFAPAVAGIALSMAAPALAQSARPPCAPDNGGLTLPDGFCAIVVAENLGAARHIAVAENGDVFVALNRSRRGGEPANFAVLRDTDGDGVADEIRKYGALGGTGIRLRDGWLYFGANDQILRYPWPTGALEPAGEPETVVTGLPDCCGHAAKGFAIGTDGALYVNVGSPSNACQEGRGRQPGNPGLDPCPQRETRAGVWRFSADRLGQTQSDGVHYATGLRNTFALDIHPGSGVLHGVQHGRDQLSQLWPDLYTNEESAVKPGEEFVRIEEGDDFGWPYCYYDPETRTKVLGPEYGGDGQRPERCAEKKNPLLAFPGHWAPMALQFYTGSQFPAHYRGGAFVAFHGSWNRAPLPQDGYRIAFVPFDGTEPSGSYETFADGFAGPNKSPGGALHRPSGLAQGPDGSLYVADDRGGTVFRIIYRDR